MESCSRVAFLGAKKVGKTCLITQLLKKSLPTKYSPTIETMFRYDIQTAEDSFTKLEIVDTAGNFEFPNMLKKAVRSCHAFVLVFDLSNPMRTFEEIEMLRQLIIEEKGTEYAPIIVIGNKKDLVYGQDSVDNKILDTMYLLTGIVLTSHMQNVTYIFSDVIQLYTLLQKTTDQD